MTLAKDLFIKLAFHAKMHQLLEYGSDYTPSEHEFHKAVAKQELEHRAHEQVSQAETRVDKKALEGADVERLRGIVEELRAEFDSMKEQKE